MCFTTTLIPLQWPIIYGWQTERDKWANFWISKGLAALEVHFFFLFFFMLEHLCNSLAILIFFWFVLLFSSLQSRICFHYDHSWHFFQSWGKNNHSNHYFSSKLILTFSLTLNYLSWKAVLAETSKGSVCVGDEVSLADICLIPQIANAIK